VEDLALEDAIEVATPELFICGSAVGHWSAEFIPLRLDWASDPRTPIGVLR